MTNKEVTTLVNNAKNKTWFKNLEVGFNYPHLNLEIHKSGFFDIFQYVARQVRGWEKIEGDLPREFSHSKQDFQNLQKQLESFIQSYNQLEGNNSLDSNWNSLQNSFRSFNQNKRFPINQPATIFLIETYKISNSHFLGAHQYLFNSTRLNFENNKEFAGGVMAYEYQFEDATKIPRRRNSERSSNKQIRNNFEKSFTEIQNNVTDFFEDYKNQSKQQARDVLELVKTKKEEYENWVEECKKNDQVYTKQSLERAKELEKLYAANLQVAMPAKHWKDRADDMKIEGDKWRNWFIGSIIFGVIALILIIVIISNKTIEDLFSSYGNAIRFSVILITIVSLLVYGIRSFAKLMFSSYHLRRDAQERQQLAYFYLALIEYKGIEDSERHLIIQSLFSRADSGLLKDDSGPSMPSSGIIDKVIGGK